MEINWDIVSQRYEELTQKLLQPTLEVNQRQEIQKEHSRLGILLEHHKTITTRERMLTALQKEKEGASSEMQELYQEEILRIQEELDQANQALEGILYPPDPLDDRSIFVEIRAGTGGQEAALFAADLMKMYMAYALKMGWHATVTDVSTTDLGGIREVILHIEGKGVYGHLRYEGGVHRVQRVPKTETAGRVHTSTATVAILPEAQEVDISINPADLRIDTYRASGAGGQHVNKTDSAVRITHIPTGIVVACQEERSQHKNKAKAMKMLQSRLLVQQQEKQELEMSQKRKEMVGTGMRAEKVRTYNYPQNRITDHQVDLTLKNLDVVMTGELDDIIQALMQKAKQDRRQHQNTLV